MFTVNPGDIVQLKEPYKPHDVIDLMRSNPQVYQHLGLEGLRASERYTLYQRWKGFTYGIVAQILDRGRRCALHLYSDEGLIYREIDTPIPSYVDFCTDELVLIKRASVVGYETFTVENQRALESEFEINNDSNN